MADDESPIDDTELLDFLRLDQDSPNFMAAEPDGKSNGKFYEASEEVPDELIDDGPIRGDGSCKICGEPTFRPPGLTKTGRLKRAPVYCDIHNPKIVRERGSEYSSAQLDAQLRKVSGELAEEVMLTGTLFAPFFPVTGMYMVQNAEDFTDALLRIFKNSPRVMRVLHRTSQIAPIYRVGKFGAGVGTSMQVDKKQHDPHSAMAQRLGVSLAYDAVYPNTNVNSTPSNGVNSMFSGPPRYATVQ